MSATPSGRTCRKCPLRRPRLSAASATADRAFPPRTGSVRTGGRCRGSVPHHRGMLSRPTDFTLASIPLCNTVFSRSSALPSHSARAARPRRVLGGRSLDQACDQCVLRRKPVVEAPLEIPASAIRSFRLMLSYPCWRNSASARSSISALRMSGCLTTRGRPAIPSCGRRRLGASVSAVPTDVGQIQPDQTQADAHQPDPRRCTRAVYGVAGCAVDPGHGQQQHAACRP